MKKFLISLLVITTGTLYAQQGGTVVFGNNSSSIITNGQSGLPIRTNDGVKAALYCAPLGSSTFAKISAPVSVGVVSVQSQLIPLDGIFLGGTCSTGLSGGSTNQFQVRAWSGPYANYEDAANAHDPNVLLGESVVVLVMTGNPGGAPPTPPAALVGLQSFGVMPNSNSGSTATAGGSQTICAGSNTAGLGGTVGGSATGGTWSSSGTGSFSPNATTLNASYSPSQADVSAGAVTLTLTPVGPPPAVTAQVVVTINPAATAQTSGNQTVCAGSSTTALGGSVGGGATGGVWSSSGTGTFSPSAISQPARLR
jgi:hypothetical protein